jgi:hypothetical protein
MKTRIIKLTNELFKAIFFAANIYTYGQIRIVNNAAANSNAPNSSAFIDASSVITNNSTSNVGKGLLYPRTDLRDFTAFGGAPTGIPNSYPTLYDGMIVYNTANDGVAGIGATEGTLCHGFWYYHNPTTNINGGIWRPLRPCSTFPIPGTITAFECNTIGYSGTVAAGFGASNTSFVVTYQGGNGGVYNSQSVSSTGVTGLTAELVAGNFANGTGTLTYTITGTPSEAGAALFDINIGGQQCFDVPFPVICGAYIAPGVFKKFMCHNLGADTSLPPFTPATGIRGAKYQWGKANPALTQAQDQANPGPVAGWNTTWPPDNSWLDGSKTVDDPCPAGYRVPTGVQWKGVIDNNTKTLVGPLPGNQFGVKFGSALMLPTAGMRGYVDGTGGPDNEWGYYWSSSLMPRNLMLGGATAVQMMSLAPTYAIPIRCISE